MREILFRGKRRDTGEWVLGFLERRPAAAEIPGYGLWYIFMGTGDPAGPFTFGEVDPETVGQSTGLTDRNGKTIFEGDIVLDTATGEKYEILYNYGGFVMADKNRFFRSLSLYMDDDYEIIGNIYENPELLPGGTAMKTKKPDTPAERAVKIAASIMYENGVCRYDDTAKCRRFPGFAGYGPDGEICKNCLASFLRSRARHELRKEAQHGTA